jgi:hypothetical protein
MEKHNKICPQKNHWYIPTTTTTSTHWCKREDESKEPNFQVGSTYLVSSKLQRGYGGGVGEEQGRGEGRVFLELVNQWMSHCWEAAGSLHGQVAAATFWNYFVWYKTRWNI